MALGTGSYLEEKCGVSFPALWDFYSGRQVRGYCRQFWPIQRYYLSEVATDTKRWASSKIHVRAYVDGRRAVAFDLCVTLPSVFGTGPAWLAQLAIEFAVLSNQNVSRNCCNVKGKEPTAENLPLV
jgi:hypothetical protein